MTNFAGDIPAVHAVILWGKEGYALTQYEKWGEIRTPHHDGKKDNDVIILGDSQTEGLQVGDDYKFTSVAETVLRQDGYDVDLHNMGRSGLAMADYVSWIPPYQALYRSKVIVVQLTENDFIESFHMGQFNYFVTADNEKIDISEVSNVEEVNLHPQGILSKYNVNSILPCLGSIFNDEENKIKNIQDHLNKILPNVATFEMR